MTIKLPSMRHEHLVKPQWKSKAEYHEYLRRTEEIRPVRASQYVPGAPATKMCIETHDQKPVMRNGKPWMLDAPEAQYFAAAMKVKREPHKNDIIQNKTHFKPSEIIQVVAPGPNGTNYYRELRTDLTTIVVNKAIEIPGIRKDVWLVADSNAHAYKDTRTSWFQYGLDNYYDIACFDSGKLLEEYPDVPWVHDWGPFVQQGFSSCLPNVLRGGITITGQATQLGYWWDARQVILCGADMARNLYYDGSGTYVAKRAGDWNWIVPRFNALIEWMFIHGCIVTSLSPTALKVCKPDGSSWNLEGVD